MDIYLYSFNKRNNSTRQPYGGLKVSGELKESSSILSPSVSFGGIEPEYNYAHIPEFDRYYWVRDWTYSGGLWTASMEVDVLASWRSYIGSSTQFVVRSSAAVDGDVIDSMYPATNIAQVFTNTVDSPWDPSNITYVVGILGGGSGGAVTYYFMTPAQFTQLGEYLMNDVEWVGTDLGELTADVLKAEFNPLQYISSVYAIPFAAGGFSRQIKFGWWTVPVNASPASSAMSFQISLSVPKHPQNARGNYLNGPPYSSFTLFMPQFGQIPLDGNILAGVSSVTCEVQYDVKSNTAILYVRAGNSLIYQSSAEFGATVQVGQIATSKIDMVVGAAKAATSIFTGDLGDAVSGAADAIKSIFPQSSTKGAAGTLAAFYQAPALQAKFMLVTDDDNVDIGRPLYQPRTISSLPGYVQTRNADISAPATAEEITRIENELNGGIFYE